MAITNFIPEVWAARLLTSLKTGHVYAQPGVVNRNYEGEIAAAGDTVKITAIGRPAITTYTKNSNDIDPETLTDSSQSLVIDQAKKFAFEVDDIDARQAAGGLLGEALDEASYGLSDVADQYVGGLYTGVAAGNDLGTVAVTSGDLAYTQLRELMVLLDEADVPREHRYAVVPPWYHGLLLDNSKFVDASQYGSNAPILNGEVGRVPRASGARVEQHPEPGRRRQRRHGRLPGCHHLRRAGRLG